MPHVFGGKWQRRILHTLAEARAPLTTRQLRIRCGMTYEHDPCGSGMRNALMSCVRAGAITRVARGLFQRQED